MHWVSVLHAPYVAPIDIHHTPLTPCDTPNLGVYSFVPGRVGGRGSGFALRPCSIKFRPQRSFNILPILLLRQLSLLNKRGAASLLGGRLSPATLIMAKETWHPSYRGTESLPPPLRILHGTREIEVGRHC